MMSDMSWTNVGEGDWQRPPLSGHNCQTLPASGYCDVGGPFIDSNVLYADGHAVTRRTCEYYVLRSSGVYFSY